MKDIIQIIETISSAGIVGLLIYFFIYYRKPMKSVLEALGDVDKFKAGPVEFKRRQQLEVVKDIISSSSSSSSSSSVSELPSESNNISESNSDVSDFDVLLYRAQLLETENKGLKKQLLGMTSIVASLGGELLKFDPQLQKYVEEVALKLRKDISESEPNAPILTSTEQIFRVVVADELAVSDHVDVKVVQKDDKAKESQQSKP